MTLENFEHLLYGKTGTLPPSPETLLWVTANKIIGSYWRFIRIPAPKPVAKKKKQLAFAENTTGAVSAKTKMGLFLHQAGICSSDTRNFEDVTARHPQNVTARHPQKYYTFFTLRIPAIGTDKTGHRTVMVLGTGHSKIQKPEYITVKSFIESVIFTCVGLSERTNTCP